MIDYPSILQIETSGTCNAACSFCPHSTMSNRTAKDRMSGERFRSIIDEVATWDKHPSYICPFLTNEPFADARMYDFCAYINEKLPTTELVFFTNGSLFTERNIEKLKRIKRIQKIFCSVHHGTKEAYEAELKIPFDKTVESIKRLLGAGLSMPITILRVRDGDPEKDARFVAMCRREFPDAQPQLSYRYNWKGDVDSYVNYEDTLDIVCPRHNTLTILCDGRVSLCCMDQSGEYALGDSNSATLLDIYNSTIAVNYRSKTKRENSPCNQCNMRG